MIAAPAAARPPGAATRALVLLAYAALVCAHMPNIVLKGRFFAEEGTIFFQKALDMPPLAALLSPHGGYLNLLASFGTVAARWLMPLTLAPYLTITLALLVQLIPPALLLTARDPWLRHWPVRAAGLLLLLFVPAEDEIWLQTLHSQFVLILCCGIILALRPVAGAGGLVRLVLLFLTPLCGPGVIPLAPLFLLRAWLDRSGARLAQGLALGTGAVIQMLVFYTPIPYRTLVFDPVVLLCVATLRHLEAPFLGNAHAETYAHAVSAFLDLGRTPPRAAVAPLLVFPLVLAATLYRRESRPAAWLLIAGGMAAGAAYLGALGSARTLVTAYGGERYVYAPQAMFGLVVLIVAATSALWLRAVAWVLVAWLIVVGASDWTYPWPMIADGPRWSREIKDWRADPSHTPRVWPENWTVHPR